MNESEFEAVSRLAASLALAYKELARAAHVVVSELPEWESTLKPKIAEAMATICWDLLESNVYQAYPQLRPRD